MPFFKNNMHGYMSNLNWKSSHQQIDGYILVMFSSDTIAWVNYNKVP